MTFGSYLHRQRAARGLPPGLFALRLGVSTAYLADLEANRTVPTYVDLRTMAEALQLPERVLLARAGYVRMAVLNEDERELAAR